MQLWGSLRGVSCSPFPLRKSHCSLEFCMIISHLRLIVNPINTNDFTWPLFTDVLMFPFNFCHVPIFPGAPKRPQTVQYVLCNLNKRKINKNMVKIIRWNHTHYFRRTPQFISSLDILKNVQFWAKIVLEITINKQAQFIHWDFA